MSRWLRLELWWRAQRYRLRLDPAEIAWLQGYLEFGDCAVDIGAHKGGYAYWMLQAVGWTGQVFAFEPQPVLAAYLRRVKAELGAANLIVEELAVSEAPGEAMLSVPNKASSPGATLETRGQAAQQSHRVRTTSLDAYFGERAPRIRVIKCDVEGHELAVFRGAERILREQKPALLFECEQRHNAARPVAAVFRYLESLGYRGAFFERSGTAAIEEFSAARQATPRSANYVNNFLFLST